MSQLAGSTRGADTTGPRVPLDPGTEHGLRQDVAAALGSFRWRGSPRCAMFWECRRDKMDSEDDDTVPEIVAISTLARPKISYSTSHIDIQ